MPNDCKSSRFYHNAYRAPIGCGKGQDRYSLIKITAEAIKVIQTDRDYTKKVIMKWMPMKDADLLEQAYLFAQENYSREGLVNDGALRSMVKQMMASNLVDLKLAASTPVTAYYDNRYVEEVKRSGFFDQLWR